MTMKKKTFQYRASTSDSRNDAPGGQIINVDLDMGLALHRSIARRLGLNIPIAKKRSKYDTRAGLEGSLDKSGECWEWKKQRNRDGYGTYIWRGKTKMAHRAMWEFINGPIPSGLVVMHMCDNPACSNPAHLRLGTHLENKRDSISKGRHMHGERAWNNKLTLEQVKEIKRDGHTWGMGRVLAKKFGVSFTTVSTIVRGRNWAHVT